MRNRKMPLLVCVLVAWALLAGCLPGTPDGPKSQPPLEETSWRLEALGQNGDLRLALSAVEVTLSFSADSRVSGYASCNTLFGQYSSQTNGTLSMGNLGSTKIFCSEPGVMQQEQDFLNALAAAEQYELEGNLLHIRGGGMELVLSSA